MKILALETATEACSAALLMDGEILSRYRVEPRRHSELILPMMEELLADAGIGLRQLDAVAFGRGPGAFTGVRIATGVAQGVAYAADLPVVPVSTLAALAQRGYRELGKVNLLTAFDARMGEVYWGGYRIIEGLAGAVIDEQVSTPDAVTLPGGDDWFGVGTGWGTYSEVLRDRIGAAFQGERADLYCSAHDVALLAAADFARGKTVSADQAYPVYLRDKVAAKPKPTLL